MKYKDGYFKSEGFLDASHSNHVFQCDDWEVNAAFTLQSNGESNYVCSLMHPWLSSDASPLTQCMLKQAAVICDSEQD